MIKRERKKKRKIRPGRRSGIIFIRKMKWNAAAAAVLTVMLLLCDIPGPVRTSSAMGARTRQNSRPVGNESSRDDALSENLNSAAKKTKSRNEAEAEMKAETETETEAESETETESEPEQQGMTKPETGPEMQKQTDSETQPGSGPQEQPESETQPGPGQQGQTDSETQPGPGPQEQPELETQTESEAQSGSEGKSESEDQTESEPEVQPESENQSESENQPESENQSELESESQLESESESESQSESESENQSESELEDQSESESENQSESEVQSESELEDQSESESESQTESESEDQSEAEDQLESEPENQSESEPEAQSETEAQSEPEITEVQTESLLESETSAGIGIVQEGGPEAEPESESRSKLPAFVEIPAKTGAVPKETEPQLSGQTQKKTQAGSLKEQQEEAAGGKKEEGKAVRGQDYEIRGDEGAWYRDASGRLWVRRGSGLSADPVGGTYNQGSRMTVSGGDGVFHFQLRKTDANGKILEKSSGIYENYYVDQDVPSARITADGVKLGNLIFSQTGAVSVVTPPDAQSGLKQTSYQVAACDENGSDAGIPQDKSAWISCGSQSAVSLSEEGFYRVYARTEDRVGNVSISKSDVLCVDRTMPELLVEGIQDRTANSGEISVKVICSDERYQKGSLQAWITGLNNGVVAEPLRKKERNKGAVVLFGDFPKEQKYDDIYVLTVRAQDLAGNISEKSMKFSVNRCGSVYDLNENTRENLQKYYVQDPFDVLISETNIDYVGESKIFCRRDGILQELVKGKDYQVTMDGGEDSWKQYQYRISQDVFSEEGVYELLLTSTDKANNSSDTGVQKKKMTFAVDRTPPTCIISGIEEQGIYEASQMNVRVHAEDNLCLKTMKVYRNGEVWKELSAAELEELEGVVDLSVDQKNSWQTLQVYLEDACGNTYQSREMPFYLSANGKGADVPAYKTGKIDKKTDWEKTEKRAEGSVFPAFVQVSRTRYGTAVLLAGGLSFLAVLLYCGFSGIKRKG